MPHRPSAPTWPERSAHSLRSEGGCERSEACTDLVRRACPSSCAPRAACSWCTRLSSSCPRALLAPGRGAPDRRRACMNGPTPVATLPGPRSAIPRGSGQGLVACSQRAAPTVPAPARMHLMPDGWRAPHQITPCPRPDGTSTQSNARASTELYTRGPTREVKPLLGAPHSQQVGRQEDEPRGGR